MKIILKKLLSFISVFYQNYFHIITWNMSLAFNIINDTTRDTRNTYIHNNSSTNIALYIKYKKKIILKNFSLLHIYLYIFAYICFLLISTLSHGT